MYDGLEASLRVRVAGSGGACEMEDSLGLSLQELMMTTMDLVVAFGVDE
jgi:hypothetical protein